MELTDLYVGILLTAWLLVTGSLVLRTHTWAGAVQALRLRWDREQRQAGGAPALQVRQQEQAHFEELVSAKPSFPVWLHLVLTVALIAYALMLAWDIDKLRYIGLRMVAPLGGACVALMILAWSAMKSGIDRLAVISSTLYGPAPPRVKVRDVRVVENTDSEPS